MPANAFWEISNQPRYHWLVVIGCTESIVPFFFLLLPELVTIGKRGEEKWSVIGLLALVTGTWVGKVGRRR